MGGGVRGAARDATREAASGRPEGEGYLGVFLSIMGLRALLGNYR